MDLSPKKTPTREEQIRQLVASARKDMEESAEKSRRREEESAKDREAAEATSRGLADALETFLVKPAEDEQQPINLESKMSEAMDHG